MVHFVGAGSGAADLITVRGARLLGEADVVVWAGSLVNPALLDYAKPGCEIHDSAGMTLEQVLAVVEAAEAAGKTTVRLHTGDSSIYGAVVFSKVYGILGETENARALLARISE